LAPKEKSKKKVLAWEKKKEISLRGCRETRTEGNYPAKAEGGDEQKKLVLKFGRENVF